MRAATAEARLDHPPTLVPGLGVAWSADSQASGWDRKGVAQFHQPHNVFPRFRQILDCELPGLVDRLVAAGCVWLDALVLMPPSIAAARPAPTTTSSGS